MFCRSCLAIALLLTFTLAACGPDTPTPEPSGSVQDTLAVSTEAVAGTYRLVAINENPLPSRIGSVDECEVQLSEGRLKLDAEAKYKLDVLARAVCDEEEDEEAQMIDRATGEGPYTVTGSEIRFSPAPKESGEDMEEMSDEKRMEEKIKEAEDDASATLELYDAKQFAGVGMLRDTLLTVRLPDDTTTLSFVKE